MIIVCRGTYSEPGNEYWLGVWVEPACDTGTPARVAQVIGDSAQDALENAWLTFGSRPSLVYSSSGPTIMRIMQGLAS